jgi:SagB-type dehydrogenase family enzyme
LILNDNLSFAQGSIINFLECNAGSMSEEHTTITLPPPRFDSAYSIEKALLNRRSVRRYLPRALSREELAQLLWACQGISRVQSWQVGRRNMQTSYRTAPSAGALYPLELYVMVTRVEKTEPGLYHYLPGPGKEDHAIELLQAGERSADLAEAALGQRFITEAAANLIIGGVVGRMAVKYGRRARLYVVLEVGHAAQNLCLQAPSLGIGVVPIGAFSDAEVRRFVGEEVEPFYILSVGKIG